MAFHLEDAPECSAHAAHSGAAILVLDPAAQTAGLALARGCYQRALLRGVACLSGADLAGKASRYSARYAESRENLFDRLLQAGVLVRETRASHGRRVLVIGE